MTRLHHLAVTCTDLNASRAWYDQFLGALGYTPGIVDTTICTWTGQDPEILLYPVEGSDRAPHTHGRPGWQHAAFRVDDRSTLDAVDQAVAGHGGQVVHPPQDFPYLPGYHAVFVTDPDGVRWEVAHIPDPA